MQYSLKKGVLVHLIPNSKEYWNMHMLAKLNGKAFQLHVGWATQQLSQNWCSWEFVANSPSNTLTTMIGRSQSPCTPGFSGVKSPAAVLSWACFPHSVIFFSEDYVQRFWAVSMNLGSLGQNSNASEPGYSTCQPQIMQKMWPAPLLWAASRRDHPKSLSPRSQSWCDPWGVTPTSRGN